MKVILTETIESLGIIGSEVSVAKGYARNYLLPQGKAMVSTPQNRKRLEQERTKFELQIAKEKAFAEEMAKRLEGVECTVKAKTSDLEKEMSQSRLPTGTVTYIIKDGRKVATEISFKSRAGWGIKKKKKNKTTPKTPQKSFFFNQI